jgi:hypothetical protein
VTTINIKYPATRLNGRIRDRPPPARCARRANAASDLSPSTRWIKAFCLVACPSDVRAPSLLLTALLLASGCCGGSLGRIEPRDPAEYAARARDLLKEAPPGFTAAIAPPFIVLGDGPPEVVRSDADDLVKWASKRLKAEYFARDPGDIVSIWLFEGEDSYQRNANILFGGTPPSPYGYYSPCDDALVIDISLGGGTLVHEMVHAFMAANFPACPAWLNEGMASLYEQTGERGGRIWGLVNWRLPGLKSAIAAGRAPSLAALMKTSTREFYSPDARGLHYAAARYLCFYLQEKGLLRAFYYRFNAEQGRDPEGDEVLREILGGRSMDAIQKDWEAFVAALPDP